MKDVGLQLCFIAKSTLVLCKDDADLTDVLNDSTASTFRRKFKLLLHYFFH